MRVLGIDPGTVVVGWGVVDSNDGRELMTACGILTASSKLPPAVRLSKLYKGLEKLVAQYKPDVVAVETPFVSQNVSTALAIGRAQAIALLAAANKGIPTFEYSPAQIKQRVASYGASSKEQIQQMVKLHLGLEEIPEPSDAADALAVALCHLSEVHVSGLLGETQSKKKRRAV
ncbi:MAG: crossover junction endodeoxyribonuclease RuvC [bacterium]|nr:crossover junction endodeoxyribonuclease RuvC [bacterium]